MPIYTFQCTNEDCKLEFDNYLSMDDRDNEIYCPEYAEESNRTISVSSLAGFDNLGRSR